MSFKVSRWNLFILVTVAVLAGILGYSIRDLLLNPGNSTLLVAVTAGGVSLFSAVLTNVYGRIQERKIKIEEDLRAKRTPVYEGVVSFLMATFSAGSTSTDEQSKFWKETNPQMTLWASDELLAQWSNFKYELAHQPAVKGSEESDEEKIARTIKLSKELEKVLSLIRKDLGYENEKDQIKEFDMVSLFINDLYDHVDRPKRSR